MPTSIAATPSTSAWCIFGQQRDAAVGQARRSRAAPTAAASGPAGATSPGRRRRRAPRRRPVPAARRGARASRGRSRRRRPTPGWRARAAASCEPLAVARDQVQPRLEPLERPRRSCTPGPALEDEQPADGHVHRPVLGGQRGAVGGGERLGHRPASRRLAGRHPQRAVEADDLAVEHRVLDDVRGELRELLRAGRAAAGTGPARRARRAPPRAARPAAACRTGPGAIVITRMPLSARSRAAGSVMPTMPPLDAE